MTVFGPLRTAVLYVVCAGLVAACGGDNAGPPAGTEPATDAAAESAVMIYASHNAAETAAVLDAYRQQNGQRFQLLTDDMREQEVRLGNPALLPEADLFIGASLAELWAVAENDALRPEFSSSLAESVPPALRDPESRWFALSRRARVVAYNTSGVSAERLARVQSYGALGDEQWAGELCISSSGVPANRSLVAFLIREHGVREAEIIVRQWRANLAMTVFANDGTLLTAIADGRCGLGLVDSNVLASFLQSSSDAPVAAHWFDDPQTTLIDISGAGITRHASDASAARQLLEWLVGEQANALYSSLRFEFPVNGRAHADSAVSAWSARLGESQSLAELGFLLEEAELLIERARYP